MTTNTKPVYAALAHPEWRHVEKIALEEFLPQDWQLLGLVVAMFEA